MKNLLFMLLVFISILGCKDKTENKVEQSQPDHYAVEMKSNGLDQLEIGCYGYNSSGNNLKMEVITIDGNSVTAKLSYAYAEKDKNVGTFKGNLKGNKLIGKYTFMSEGIESVRDVAFKIEEDQIVEGFGDLGEGGMTFKDTTNITYSITTPWKKAVCDK